MIQRKHPTYPKRRKNVHCRYSNNHRLKYDVFFYILLIFLSKIKKAQSQLANDLNENISNIANSPNSPANFSFSENSSHTYQAVPTIAEQATEITPLIKPDSSSSIATFHRSPATFKKSVSNIDDLEFAKIEPSDHRNMIKVQSEKLEETSDIVVSSKTNSNDDFCSKNSSLISFNSTGGTEFEVVEEINSTIANSNDDFCKKNSSLISFNGTGGTESEVNEETNPSTLNLTRFTIPDKKEYREAEKMTKCTPKDFNKGGIVCVCNKTYCDKLLPIPVPNPWNFFWYKSSHDGYRFHRTDGQLSKWSTKDYVNDSIFITTDLEGVKDPRTIIGYGGAFSDSACRNIQSLSEQTRRHFMQSYYGLYGLEYNLGRVPIGGTDFSPKFYTYMDVPKKFKFNEQDFKYKIPVIQEAIKIIPKQLKLVGCSWTAPKWMKTACKNFDGELKPEYYQLYAEYHAMFLDHYAKNGIEFWALSAGNNPMMPYKVTKPPFMINGMKWSPYKQSKWVNQYLKPTLNSSGYQHVELIIGDENRDMITYYLKWFFEPLRGEKCYDDGNIYLKNEAFNDVSGISVHGYFDFPQNEIFLTQLQKTYYKNKFIILGETACSGKPQLGAWDCAERYGKQIMNYFHHGSTGFIDWNLALDLEGGPAYLNNFLDAAIIINTEKDEFYKQPMYYVIAHFSKFMIPGSAILPHIFPNNSTSTGIAVIAAVRPDDSLVIVAYNRSPKMQNAVFVIDRQHQLSLNISAKSINSVIIEYPETK